MEDRSGRREKKSGCLHSPQDKWGGGESLKDGKGGEQRHRLGARGPSWSEGVEVHLKEKRTQEKSRSNTLKRVVGKRGPALPISSLKTGHSN